MKRTFSLSVFAISAFCALFLTGVAALAGFPTKDTLSVVRRGCKNALSCIVDGRGKVTIAGSDWSASGVLKRSKTVYNVKFVGDKFRLSRRGIFPVYLGSKLIGQDSPVTIETGYDGTRAVLLETRKGRPAHATIGAAGSFLADYLAREYKDDVAFRGKGLIDLDNYESRPPHSIKTGPRIKGHEAVDGHACLVVETRYRRSSEGVTDWLLHWVDPTRGYTVVKTQSWVQGGSYRHKTMVAQQVVSVRNYGGGVWGPAKVTHTQYSLRKGTGKLYKEFQSVVTYHAGFALNMGVTQDELAIQLPSGTRVEDVSSKTKYTVP